MFFKKFLINLAKIKILIFEDEIFLYIPMSFKNVIIHLAKIKIPT